MHFGTEWGKILNIASPGAMHRSEIIIMIASRAAVPPDSHIFCRYPEIPHGFGAPSDQNLRFRPLSTLPPASAEVFDDFMASSSRFE